MTEKELREKNTELWENLRFNFNYDINIFRPNALRNGRSDRNSAFFGCRGKNCKRC